MMRKRRGILLIGLICISLFLLLRQKSSTSVSVSQSNVKAQNMHQQFETDKKFVTEKKSKKILVENKINKKEEIKPIVNPDEKVILHKEENKIEAEPTAKGKEEKKIDTKNQDEMPTPTKQNLFQPDPENDRKTAARFQNRVKQMKSRCPGWEYAPLKRNWVINKNFLINYPRRLLVCAVPKAGSTSWHFMIWGMRRIQAGLDPNPKYYTYNDTVENHHTAEKLSPAHGKELIFYHKGDDDMFRNPPTEKAQRILLTRHPFARMISGWHQKFLPGSPYADLLFRRYPTLKSYVRLKDPDHRMAWKDFAEFIAENGKRSQDLDYHFISTVEICKPCEYAYSYIIKAESIDMDESWLFRRLNITDIDIGRRGMPPGGSIVNSSPSDNIKKYMSQLRDSVRRKLYDIYKEDFLMFGYTFDFRTLRSGGFE